MNQGVVQSSTVQQIVAGAGGPTWWSITNMSPLINPHHHHHQNNNSNLWNDSQLLLGGLVGDEDKPAGLSNMQAKKLENWEHEFLNQTTTSINGWGVDVKQSNNCWSHHQMVSASLSPKSCITNNNMLYFSPKSSDIGKRSQQEYPSSECNSTSATGGGAAKKPRTQPSSAQSTFKVRKEKLGDRITALHQIVSPFGKTDTASVLLEAIGYIKFLQSQIEALSQPYFGSGSSANIKPQHHDSDEDQEKDLRSRGLCLVPISCTLHVGNDNVGADYWAPAFDASFR